MIWQWLRQRVTGDMGSGALCLRPVCSCSCCLLFFVAVLAVFWRLVSFLFSSCERLIVLSIQTGRMFAVVPVSAVKGFASGARPGELVSGVFPWAQGCPATVYENEGMASIDVTDLVCRRDYANLDWLRADMLPAVRDLMNRVFDETPELFSLVSFEGVFFEAGERPGVWRVSVPASSGGDREMVATRAWDGGVVALSGGVVAPAAG